MNIYIYIRSKQGVCSLVRLLQSSLTLYHWKNVDFTR